MDDLGWRATFGVVAPSTNTVVQTDFTTMAPPGVTVHLGRVHVRDSDLSSNDGFRSLLDQIRDEIPGAIQRVLTCEPDHLVMGMSAETFWGGKDGNASFEQRINAIAGMPVTTGASACEEALARFGVSHIGVVTPYQPIAHEQVERYFADIGMDVTEIIGLKCRSAVEIARVGEERLIGVLGDLHRRGVEAIVQVGTNLSMVSLADEAERWLGIPVVAINAATWWLALRKAGITDRIYGAGRLLREW